MALSDPKKPDVVPGDTSEEEVSDNMQPLAKLSFSATKETDVVPGNISKKVGDHSLQTNVTVRKDSFSGNTSASGAPAVLIAGGIATFLGFLGAGIFMALSGNSEKSKKK